MLFNTLLIVFTVSFVFNYSYGQQPETDELVRRVRDVNEDEVLITTTVMTEITESENENNIRKLKDYEFIPGTNGLYKFQKTLSNINDAKTTCEDEGASIFYPETESELNSVISYWKNKYEGSFPVDILIGFIRSNKHFKPIDSTLSSDAYFNWGPNEPNNSNNKENCVILIVKNNRMNDINCEWKYPFICKSSVSEWNEECNMQNLDYGFVEEMGKCYKFHLKPQNWTEAQATCRAEQSQLAVINSPEEATYLVKLTRKVLRTVPGRFTHGIILLGFHKNNVEDWQTIEDTSLYYSGYTCWGNSQPDSKGLDRCGSMFYNGHLNDIGCDQKAFFICEHEIKAPNYVHEPRSFYNIIRGLECAGISA